MVEQKFPKLLPGIEEYLETVDNKKSITAQGLEEFVTQVQLKTGLDKATSKIVVQAFFQEIRNSMLRGDVVTLRRLGKFFVSSPRNSKNKERVFPVFKPYNQLIRKLNDP